MSNGVFASRPARVEINHHLVHDQQVAVLQFVRTVAAAVSASLNDVTVDGPPSIQIWVDGRPLHAYSLMFFGDIHRIQAVSLEVDDKDDDRYYLVLRHGNTSDEWFFEQSTYHFIGDDGDSVPHIQLFTGPFSTYVAALHDRDSSDSVIASTGF